MTTNATLQTLIGDAQAAIGSLNVTLTDIATQQEATTLIPADPTLVQDQVVQGIENGVVYNRVGQSVTNTTDNKYKNSFKLPNASINSVFTLGTIVSGTLANIQARVKKVDDTSFGAWQALSGLSGALFNAIEFLSTEAFEFLSEIGATLSYSNVSLVPIADAVPFNDQETLGLLTATSTAIVVQSYGSNGYNIAVARCELPSNNSFTQVEIEYTASQNDTLYFVRGFNDYDQLAITPGSGTWVVTVPVGLAWCNIHSHRHSGTPRDTEIINVTFS
jgi:hypothetical protein